MEYLFLISTLGLCGISYIMGHAEGRAKGFKEALKIHQENS